MENTFPYACCFCPIEFELDMEALTPFIIQLFHHKLPVWSVFGNRFKGLDEPFLLTRAEKSIFAENYHLHNFNWILRLTVYSIHFLTSQLSERKYIKYKTS